ncbi:MAG TPA: hypothetical protein VGP76_11975 [Planctomycetaceae bacterium]|jgi:hypothetical protein|nr:hypothetical protein [Planctomycetaceae bacterium]
MKLPLITGKNTDFPSVAKCPQCKKRKVFEPHSMVILEGGALLLDRKRENSRVSNALSGYLALIWHGAHDHSIGDDRHLFTTMNLVDDAIGGQFSLAFCSTACLRAFLNSLVNELEKRIERDRKQLERVEKDQQRTGKLPKRVQRELDDLAKRGVLEVRPKSGRPARPGTRSS